MASEQKEIRKLRAIFSADVKGYSRLMTEDESHTIKMLKAYRSIMSEIIEQHSGRVVDAPGDNIMAEFSSVVNAVQCAVKIQAALKSNNADIPYSKRLEFRIGINIGDVVQDSDSLYGEGVNIAARIEGLADPGGVCISRGAYDHIRNKLKLGYEYIGEHTVKNIKHPVRVYKVLMSPEDAGKRTGKKPQHFHKNWTGLILFIVAVLAGIIVWQFTHQKSPPIEAALMANMAFPLPEKPSIAVLPFDNLSGDPQQDYFCDGITDNIIGALSKVQNLLVIARNSTFVYKGKAVKIRQVAEEMGVRYVLEGSVMKSEDKVRVAVQLIDAIEGHHLWADRYDRKLKDIFAIQDEITKKTIEAIHVKLTRGEDALVWGKHTNNLNAYLKELQAVEHILKFNKESMAMAQRLSKEAIELDAGYASAYRTLGVTQLHEVTLGMSKSPKDSMANAMKNVKKAIKLDDSDAKSHSVLSMLYTYTKRQDEAVVEGELAVNLNPNSADIHAYLGMAYRYVGRWEDAIEQYKKAIRLNPIPPSWYLYGIGLSYAMTGQYDEGIRECKKAIQKAPDSPYVHLHMTIIYSLAGLEEEARTQAEKLIKANSKFSVEHSKKVMPYKRQSDKKKIIDALLNSGLE